MFKKILKRGDDNNNNNELELEELSISKNERMILETPVNQFDSLYGNLGEDEAGKALKGLLKNLDYDTLMGSKKKAIQNIAMLVNCVKNNDDLDAALADIGEGKTPCIKDLFEAAIIECIEVQEESRDTTLHSKTSPSKMLTHLYANAPSLIAALNPVLVQNGNFFIDRNTPQIPTPELTEKEIYALETSMGEFYQFNPYYTQLNILPDLNDWVKEEKWMEDTQGKQVDDKTRKLLEEMFAFVNKDDIHSYEHIYDIRHIYAALVVMKNGDDNLTKTKDIARDWLRISDMEEYLPKRGKRFEIKKFYANDDAKDNAKKEAAEKNKEAGETQAKNQEEVNNFNGTNMVGILDNAIWALAQERASTNKGIKGLFRGQEQQNDHGDLLNYLIKNTNIKVLSRLMEKVLNKALDSGHITSKALQEKLTTAIANAPKKMARKEF